MIPYFALDREFEALREPIMARVEEIFGSGRLLQGLGSRTSSASSRR
jgi:hypothetical protein